MLLVLGALGHQVMNAALWAHHEKWGWICCMGGTSLALGRACGDASRMLKNEKNLPTQDSDSFSTTKAELLTIECSVITPPCWVYL